MVSLSTLDLNLLVTLDAVLTERSVVRAARRLHVTPSAVSNALARARAALGDPIVVRSGRGIVPTPRALELGPAISRALGETAPLIVVGASTFITVNPSGPFSKFTALPIQIYNWTSRPQDEFHHIAAAAILVLLVLLLSLNTGVILLRNRFSRRY